MLLMTMPAQWLPSCAAWQLIINTPPWFFALTDIHNPPLGVRGALTTKLMCGALKVGNSRVTLLPAACAVGVIARVRPFLLHRSSNGLQLLGVRTLAVVALKAAPTLVPARCDGSAETPALSPLIIMFVFSAS